MEAQCLIIHYLEENEGMYLPVERNLIEVITTSDTSAESLCVGLLKSLKKEKVNLNFVVEQSYDSASNMRGRQIRPTNTNARIYQENAASLCGVMHIGLT